MSRTASWRRMRDRLSKQRNLTVIDMLRKPNRSHKKHVSKIHKDPKHKNRVEGVDSDL